MGKPLRLEAVILSAQHEEGVPLDEVFFRLTDKVLAPALTALPPDENTRLLLNPAGRFVIGGPEGDTGLTGRKLAVDAYGPSLPTGAAAFPGKTPPRWTAPGRTWPGTSPKTWWLPGSAPAAR